MRAPGRRFSALRPLAGCAEGGRSGAVHGQSDECGVNTSQGLRRGVDGAVVRDAGAWGR